MCMCVLVCWRACMRACGEARAVDASAAAQARKEYSAGVAAVANRYPMDIPLRVLLLLANPPGHEQHTQGEGQSAGPKTTTSRIISWYPASCVRCTISSLFSPQVDGLCWCRSVPLPVW